jgi:hypothetical protein
MRALLLMLSLGAALLAGGPARAQTALTQPDVERIARQNILNNPYVIYAALQ